MDSQLSMIRSLLRPYENRAWGQSNWLLLRFWLGEGFAFREARQPCVWQSRGDTSNKPTLGLHRSRSKNGSHTGLLHHIAPACPSSHFQKLISEILTDDEQYSTIFINSLLSQLNWAFSEFILLLQDIQNTSQRQEHNAIYESRQLKICSMCFELTVSLMRSLEMIITVAPQIFLDPDRPNSDILLGKVCQLVTQVLSRVTVPPGCFQHVVDLYLPDLSGITHFSILTAAIGVLMALMKDELFIDEKQTNVPRVSKSLLTDASFQIGNLEFLLNEVKTPIIATNEPLGNFDPKMRVKSEELLQTAISSNINISLPLPGVHIGREIIPDLPIIEFSLCDCKKNCCYVKCLTSIE